MEKRGDPRDVGYVSRDPWGQRNSAEGEAFAAALVNTSIALPMVAWFVSGWAAVVVTVGTVFLLLHREYFSDARWLVARITPH